MDSNGFRPANLLPTSRIPYFGRVPSLRTLRMDRQGSWEQPITHKAPAKQTSARPTKDIVRATASTAVRQVSRLSGFEDFPKAFHAYCQCAMKRRDRYAAADFVYAKLKERDPYPKGRGPGWRLMPLNQRRTALTRIAQDIINCIKDDIVQQTRASKPINGRFHGGVSAARIVLVGERRRTIFVLFQRRSMSNHIISLMTPQEFNLTMKHRLRNDPSYESASSAQRSR